MADSHGSSSTSSSLSAGIVVAIADVSVSSATTVHAVAPAVDVASDIVAYDMSKGSFVTRVARSGK